MVPDSESLQSHKTDADTILACLIWPCAAFAMAGGSWPISGWPAPAAAGLGLVAALGLSAAPQRLAAVAALAECAFAAAVVALTGGADSPWLLLFPWLLVHRGFRIGGAATAVAATPPAYLVATWLAGGLPAAPELAVHVGVFCAAAVYALLPRHAVRAAHQSDDSGQRDFGTHPRFPAGPLALFGELAGQAADGVVSEAPDPGMGARALGRSLRTLLAAGSEEDAVEVTFRRFDPGELAEAVCRDWSACGAARGVDVQAFVLPSGSQACFGDIDRTRELLDLLMMAGCFGIGSGGVELRVASGTESDSGDQVAFELRAWGQPDEDAFEGMVRQGVQKGTRRLGGGCDVDHGLLERSWRIQLPFDRVGEARPPSGSLADVAVHVTGDSELREVFESYLSEAGARLVHRASGSRVTILAESARDPATESHCQSLKAAYPGIPLLCQGSTSGSPATLKLEADRVLPVPFRRDELIQLVTFHLEERGHRPLAKPVQRLPRPGMDATPGEGYEVLVAEDDAISARVVSRFLEAEGCRIHRVHDGEAALDALKSGTAQLALLDMHMPGLGGVEVAERFRHWERHQDRQPTPLVALTASISEADRRACRDAGMNDFLNKPVDRGELREMLERYRPRRADTG